MTDIEPRRARRAPTRRGRPTGRPRDYEVELKSLNQWQLAWRKFKRHRLALVGLGCSSRMMPGRDHRPVLLPFNFTDIPRARRDRRAGRPPSPIACDALPFGRDRRAPARRPDARRQRRPDVAAHRLRRAWSIGVIIGTFVGRDRRLRRRLARQRPDAHRRRDAQPADPVRDPRRVASSSAAAAGSRVIADLRPVRLDGRQPPRPQPVPVDPRARVRRGGARRRRARPADHLPAHPAQRLQPDRRRRVADRRRRHHRRGVRELPRASASTRPRRPGATSCRTRCSSSPRATGGGRSSRASRSSSRCSPSTSWVTACATRSIRGRAHDRDDRRVAPAPVRRAARRTTSSSTSATCGPTSRSWTAIVPAVDGVDFSLERGRPLGDRRRVRARARA